MYSLDYDETYAPTAKADSIRTLLSIAAAEDCEMVQFDIKTAFLHGDLDEEIYMELPSGYDLPGSKDKVCRLTKSLYGLKQASRQWNKKFIDFLHRYDLKQSVADPCVFYSTTKPLLATTIFVDDSLGISTALDKLQHMISYLQQHFKVTTRLADVYIGLRISRDRFQRTLYVDQSRYIKTLLAKYGYTDVNPVSTPADSNVHLQRPLPDDDQPVPNFPYQNIVGSLLHVMVYTRPDIAHAVTTVAQYSSNFREIHCTAVRRIVKYLRGTTNHALCYSPSKYPGQLITYADADYAGDVNDRKSRSGCVILLNNAPVLWLSRKQSCIATSTTESEYIAAALASKETIWLRRLLTDFGLLYPGPTSLRSDNQSVVRLILNPEFHKRTKHIDIVYHKIRELQDNAEIDIIYVPTDRQFADIFTKSLTPEKFLKLRATLNIVQR